MSWRDHLKVHPAADLFPPVAEAELRELAADIKKNGLRYPIVLWREHEHGNDYLLDGRNRLDAMESVGIPTIGKDGAPWRWSFRDGDPYDLVLSFNLHRRHLTDEQRRELIAKIIKVKPEASDRAIAKQVKRDHKTVAKVRKKLESTGEVSPVQTRVGADGKQRKARAKKKDIDPYTVGDACVVAALEAESADRATGSAEVSVEQRRAAMARLDGPAEETVDEVGKRVNCVANTIRRHVEGLSYSDVERFFATLRDCIDVIELALRADES